MKLNFGTTIQEWINEYHEWHLWFAWYPVKVGVRDWRWMERVWRIRASGYDPVFGRYKEHHYGSKESQDWRNDI